jgi:hypothetical protein
MLASTPPAGPVRSRGAGLPGGTKAAAGRFGGANPARRAEALAAFYSGPVWQEHHDAANATMIDSDDVLLLRPAWHGADHRVSRSAPSALGGGRSAGPCRLRH